MKEGFPLAYFKLWLKPVRELSAQASSRVLPHSVPEVLPPFCGYCRVSPSFQTNWDAALRQEAEGRGETQPWAKLRSALKALLWPRLAEALKKQGQKHRHLRRFGSPKLVIMKILKKERSAHCSAGPAQSNNAWKYRVVEHSREEAPWKTSP